MTEIVFTDIPLLMELERWTYSEPGIMWRPAWAKKCDEVSIAVFGVTADDLKRVTPNYDDYPNAAEYEAACDEIFRWEAQFFVPPNKGLDYDHVDWLEELGINLWTADDDILRVAEFFEDQAIAAAQNIGGARFTPDGSGTRAGQTVDAWGAALQAQAAAFRSRAR